LQLQLVDTFEAGRQQGIAEERARIKFLWRGASESLATEEPGDESPGPVSLAAE
jgi:hypothetical protein